MNNLLPGLAERLAALTRGSVQTSWPIAAITDQLPEFQPGERYTAHIIETLQDGRARAQVAGQTVTLQLPQAAREGSTVSLTHVGRSAQTLIATLAPDSVDAAESDAVHISPPARNITTLLDRPPPPPTRLAAGQPLIDPAMLRAGVTGTDSIATPLVAGRLAQGIGQSGLFYESHQAQWVSGGRSIESTAGEPQRAFDPSPARATVGAPPAAVAQAPEDIDRLAAPLADTVAREPANAGKNDAAPPGELRPLVQNQLLGLSQHTLAWEGLAWPGQMMKIEVDDPRGEGRSESPDSEAAAEVPWTSRLRLVLPGLGEIETSLTLWKDHDITLGFSADPQARARMGGALVELQQRMNDAGLRLEAVSFSDLAPPADDDLAAEVAGADGPDDEGLIAS